MTEATPDITWRAGVRWAVRSLVWDETGDFLATLLFLALTEHERGAAGIDKIG